MGGVWWVLASPFLVLPMGALAFVFLVRKRRHLTDDGDIYVTRIVTVIGQSMFAYTLTVCIGSQLSRKYMADAPTFGQLIDDGIGADKIAWLLIFVAVESALKVWREFHDKNPNGLTWKRPKNGEEG